ncbi:MAG: DNA-3-methyladenine glycosylase 2 family protein [Candidatus Paceibacterota bacterium]
MRKEILSHFKEVDPVLYEYVRSQSLSFEVTPKHPSTYFESLASSIVGQQLSGKAAYSIFKKVKNLFPRKKITAKGLLKLKEKDLREAGLSHAKIAALYDLARNVEKGALPLSSLKHLSEEETHDHLIKVRGIGPWTIEMFTMFTLGHEDIFSCGDLGLKKGIKKLYSMRNLPSERRMEEITKKWRPYRTYGSLVLWSVVDTK